MSSLNDIVRKGIRYLSAKGLFDCMPDEPYLKLKYWACMGKKLNLDNPQTFNEKLQWLKLHDRKPIYTTMVDKYEVKKYVAGLIGEEYIIPTLGIWDSVEDIDFSSLPEEFVLKTTHDSGGVVICRDKSTFNIEMAKRKLDKSLKRNYYKSGREWPYKDVKPRILAEKYMEDTRSGQLKDYKIFTFNGVAKALFIASDRQDKNMETKFDFYDMDFRHLDFTNGHPTADIPPQRPERFEEMRCLAEKLSRKIPHLRVDFYEINGKTYFGELTFSHWSGMVPFEPEKWDDIFGSWIAFPKTFGGGYVLIGNEFVLWLHETNEETKQNKEMIDYKFYCFDGNPLFLYVSKGLENHKTARMDFLNIDWTKAPFYRSDYARFEKIPDKPQNYSKMLEMARLLSKDISFLRVDMYEIGDKVFFSELTFSPGSGFSAIEPEQWDVEVGSWIRI